MKLSVPGHNSHTFINILFVYGMKYCASHNIFNYCLDDRSIRMTLRA